MINTIKQYLKIFLNMPLSLNPQNKSQAKVHLKLGIKYGVILILLHLAIPLSLSATPKTIKLATGSKGGIYYPLGQAIKNVIEENLEMEIDNIETMGSVENIDKLKKNNADLAIIQSYDLNS